MTRQIEKRLVNEYLWETYREKPQWKNVRLGQVPNKAMAKLWKVQLSYADAIVLDNNIVTIIEGKMAPRPGAVGQLEYYKELFGKTPEFEQYKDNPIRLVLLSAKEDYNTRAFCDQRGVDFVLFRTDWGDKYLLERAQKGYK